MKISPQTLEELRLISKLEKPSKEKIPSTIIPAIAPLKMRLQEEEVDKPNKKMNKLSN